MIIGERFVKAMEKAGLVLTEAAVTERLRRMDNISIDPILFNTPLIYDRPGRKALEEIYGQYRNIALSAKVPMLLCAPTWRLDQERIAQAGATPEILRDAVAFMLNLRDQWDEAQSPVLVGGLMGPKNDCYRPEESLSQEDAAEFHRWQARELAAAGVEVLVAQTMPAVGEATGLAGVMAATGLPYIISFVINRNGQVLDGTPLNQAIRMMDEALDSPPFGYMVNCSYPSFVCADRQPADLFERLLGIQANSSSKDHQALDGSDATQEDSIEDWVREMLRLHHVHGMKILGGCCGTDDRYLSRIV